LQPLIVLSASLPRCVGVGCQRDESDRRLELKGVRNHEQLIEDAVVMHPECFPLNLEVPPILPRAFVEFSIRGEIPFAHRWMLVRKVLSELLQLPDE